MGLLSLIFCCAVFIWFFYDKSIMRHEGDAQQPHSKSVPDVLLVSLGKMLALMSKADGRISKREVETASRCLRSLGLKEHEYQKCVAAFNSIHQSSKDSFRKCARDYAAIVRLDACILLYEMLWKVASVDGELDASEDELLRIAIHPLGIDPSYYNYFKRMYFVSGRTAGGAGNGHDSKLKEAYAKLGCSPSDSDEAVKTAYRKLAMRYHPDRLKADGVPDSMIEMATRSMSEINAAWDLVKKERKYNG